MNYQNNLYGDKIERSIGSIYILDWKPLIKVELLGCFDARFIPYFTHIFNVLFLFLSVSLSFSVLKKPKVPELVPFISIMCLVSIHPVLFYIFLLDNVFVTFNQFRLLYNLLFLSYQALWRLSYYTKILRFSVTFNTWGNCQKWEYSVWSLLKDIPRLKNNVIYSNNNVLDDT